MNRVVITGLGALTPVGSGKKELWHALLAGKSGIDWITYFDTKGYHSNCAGEIRDFDPTQFFPPHKLKRLDRYAQFSLHVAEQALHDAGLNPTPESPRFDFGVSFGTALGGITVAEYQHERFVREGIEAIPAALALQVFGGSAHSNIAIAYGLRGYGTTNSNSCASGTVALGEAFRILREGKAAIMIAGAAEAPLSGMTYGAFDTIKAMTKEKIDPRKACRPFDQTRDGFVMAEGAAAVILETLDHAQARGAHIYGEVLGYTLNNDAYHMSSSLPEGDSAILAMRSAIEEAGIKPEQIDYINAHASSTQMNDSTEARAIAQVFGAKIPAVSGTKAYTGHPLGATGAIEAVICALALEHQTLPANLNCHTPDPELPAGFDLILGKARTQDVNYILSNSFGFGGINATLVLGKFPR